MIVADVVVVGSLNHDITVAAARRPEAGETVLGRSLASACGGKGANQAVAAARAGARVAMVGCVGADGAGERLLGALRAAGVDTGRVRVLDDEPSGTALIVVDDAGENTIVVVPGANARLAAADVEAAVSGATPEASGAHAGGAGAPASGRAARLPVVLAQLEVPEAAVAAAARGAARFVLNASPARQLPPAVLEAADPLIVNAGEAAALTGADARDPDALATAALALGVRSVVITKGAAGASWIAPDARIHRAAPQVEVVDTTGAGDVFAGTLAAALARDADPEAALAAATDAGAAAVRWHGAQAP
jgi:ribokinase